MNKKKFAAFVVALLLTGTFASADILPLSKVEKGMKGYGVTVFEGTRPDHFDVQILGVLRNVGPNQNLILARVDGPEVQRSGIIAGMSGSPIYIDGKLIGALAYAWQFAKEPIAGITPIEEMLQIDRSAAAHPPANAVPAVSGSELLKLLASRDTKEMTSIVSSKMLPAIAVPNGMKRIATPLSFSGFSSESVERFGSVFAASGFLAVPTGTTSGGATSSKNADPFTAGDSIAGVLLEGDFNVAATGTVTYVDGQRVYGFGHPFLDFGEIDFPMAKSEVVTVLPNLASSFKFANTGETVGALRQDRAAGIMGIIGEKPKMIPVELTLDDTHGKQTYHIRVTRHPELFPLLLATAADSVVSNAQRAAGERTVVLDSEIDVDGLGPIHLHEGWAGEDARQAIPMYLAVISNYLLSNEFRDTSINSVKIHLRHDDQLRTAKLVQAAVDTPPDGAFHPGDTIRVHALLKPYRGDAFKEDFELRVPDNQPAGAAYVFLGSGSALNQIDFRIVPPDPQTLEQVVDVLHRLHASTDLGVGLYAAGDGVVAAGVYMPDLPPSVHAMLDDDTTNSSQAAVKFRTPVQNVRSTDYVVDGMLKIDVQIQPKI